MFKVDIPVEVKGYVVANYFITKTAWLCITAHKPNREEKVGLSYKGKVTVEDVEYDNITPLLSKDNYKEVLKILKDNNIELRRYLYIRTSGKLEETNEIKLDSFWYDIEYPFRYFIYNTEKEKEEGYMLTLSDFYENSPTEEFYIGMLEVFDKRKYIGSDIVKELRRFRSKLKGLATKQSEPFWTKLGAQYIDKELHFRIE